MSQTIYLDPERTAVYEPREGDDRNGSWISPSNVPIAVNVGQVVGTAEIGVLIFEYRGGETDGGSRPLDGHSDPSILIKAGRFSGKILEMKFQPPVVATDFPRIADRLANYPSSLALSARFSHEMVANILRYWSDVKRSL